MARHLHILSLASAAVIFLSGCSTQKGYPPLNGGNYGNGEPPIQSGESELVNFEGKAEPLECGKNLVRRFIAIPQSNWGRTDAGKQPSSFVTYPDVCAYLGSFWFLEAAVDNAILKGDDEARDEAIGLIQGLVDKYDDVITGKARYTDSKGNSLPLFTDLLWRHESNRVDYYIFGAVSLHIASIMDDEKYEGVTWRQSRKEYLDFGLQYADNQWNPLTRAEFDARFSSPQYNHTSTLFKMSDGDWKKWESYIKDGYSWQTRLWIDDMFMITALQIQAYQATKDDPSYNTDPWWPAKTNNENRYLDRAVREMKLYIEKIQGSDGLYWHSPDAKFFWARGNGWMAVGMPEMLKIIGENPSYKAEAAQLRKEYETMMASLLKYQQPTGMWAQLIDRTSLWSETSGTAMFTYAFMTGVKNGWLDSVKYGAAARKAWNALMFYLNPNYDIREVCEGTGTGSTEQHYRDRKRYAGDTHGQAGMLWCATALTEIANGYEAGTALDFITNQ
ncbi:MAG: glycoside hydrolase family 88 protein [Clostridium sp.]|nr:glycoside hydrolase family 88 protein [Bacteroides sp.]MCM1198030.1 glycoside hydrolase family 88 protein [Clostridium sp.]